MSLIRWIRSLFSDRGLALARYRSGIAKADKHDYPGAIADYTATIEAGDTPNDVRAMAIYNRALAYSAIHEDDKADDDLETVLKMPGLSERVRSAALRRQVRIRQREDRKDRED
jgi:hypothetical protein